MQLADFERGGAEPNAEADCSLHAQRKERKQSFEGGGSQSLKEAALF